MSKTYRDIRTTCAMRTVRRKECKWRSPKASKAQVAQWIERSIREGAR